MAHQRPGGVATLGRRGKGWSTALLEAEASDTTGLYREAKGQVVAAVVEEAMTLGRRERRVEGGRAALRLAAVKGEDGRIRMKPLDSATRPLWAEMLASTEQQNARNKRSELNRKVEEKEQVQNGDAKAVMDDSIIARSVRMKDGGAVAGARELGRRVGRRVGASPERTVEKCFLCGEPSTEQVGARPVNTICCPFCFTPSSPTSALPLYLTGLRSVD